MNTIATALRSFIQENLLFGQKLTLADDDSFLEQGIIDSTGVLELVAFLEGQYQIHVADDELLPENLDSVNNVTRFVERKQQGAMAEQEQFVMSDS
ncbi:MAG: acyl carrier protein [Thermoguttaceae bacterium]|jgi:acyl carrier protein